MPEQARWGGVLKRQGAVPPSALPEQPCRGPRPVFPMTFGSQPDQPPPPWDGGVLVPPLPGSSLGPNYPPPLCDNNTNRGEQSWTFPVREASCSIITRKLVIIFAHFTNEESEAQQGVKLFRDT